MRTVVEGQKEFGAVLRNIRLRHCTRLNFVTPELLAGCLYVTPNTYYKYEQGVRRISRENLSALCEFFSHDSLTVKELKDKYTEYIDNRPQVDSLLRIAAQRAPRSYLVEVQRVCYQATILYEKGDVQGGYDMARAAWEVAKTMTVKGCPTYQLAGVLARCLSQLGHNGEAISLLSLVSEVAALDDEPAMYCSLQLSLAGCKYRANIVQGAVAANEFAKVLELIRLRCNKSFDEMSGQWVWNWCDSYRSRILTLSATLEEADSQFLAYLWPEFEQFVTRFEYLGRAHANVESRVMAASRDPDLALAKISELDGNIDIFADRSYHALSRIIANFRKGEIFLAIDESDYWKKDCLRRGYINKSKNFERIGGIMRRKFDK